MRGRAELREACRFDHFAGHDSTIKTQRVGGAETRDLPAPPMRVERLTNRQFTIEPHTHRLRAEDTLHLEHDVVDKLSLHGPESIRMGRPDASQRVVKSRPHGALPIIRVVNQALRETPEQEVKLSFAPGFRLPELPGHDLEPRVFTSTYYDSADRVLASTGITLRRRTENGKSLWQLKLPRDDSRLEVEVAAGPAGPPTELQELLVGVLRGRDLEQAAKLRTRRSGIRVREAKRTVADVLVDDVSVLDGRRVTARFKELEVELVEGDDRGITRIAKALRKAGAVETDGRPKLFRALGIERSDAEISPAGSDAPELVRSMLARQLADLLVNDPGTRLGTDPENLHRMRVATRRSRAALRAARPLLEPEWTESLRGELAWLGGVLGAVRDLDVLLDNLEKEISTLDRQERKAARRLLVLIENDRQTARRSLLEALTGDRYRELLARLEEATVTLPVQNESFPVRNLAKRAFRKLQKQMRLVGPETTDSELHRARIAGKRARYAAELAEPLVGKSASRFVKRAKEFQDVIGQHQDAVVAEARVRELTAKLGGAAEAFAAGRLVEQQRERRRAARAALPSVWVKLDREGRRAWS
jgi:CHAD domain-containing protein